MPTNDVVVKFADLFEGSLEAWGREEGGCQRVPEQFQNYAEHVGRIEDHLRGGEAKGVYPMRSKIMVETGGGYVARYDWAVKWGCVDFDEGEEESWVHAKNVHLALQTFGITGWIERSRSKGYHVWVFATDWVDAPLMRRALLAACQLVDAPTREINPKQEELKQLPDGSYQLGNYVRLPYPGHVATGAWLPSLHERRVVLPPEGGTPYSLPEFVGRAYKSRTDAAALGSIATHYTPPETQVIYRDWGKSLMQGTAIDRLAGKALIIFQQGPLEGSDRSDTLWKLARYLKEDGRHTIEEALELVRDADSRWGKFHDRPDGEQRLNDLIQRAWFC